MQRFMCGLLSLLSIHPSIHPSISYNCLSLRILAWGLEPISADIRREAGYAWTGHQSVTGLTHRDKQPFTLTLTFTPTGNFRVTNKLQLHLVETHAGTGENMQTSSLFFWVFTIGVSVCCRPQFWHPSCKQAS